MKKWWARQDLNLHGLLHGILSPACLPIPPRARRGNEFAAAARSVNSFCRQSRTVACRTWPNHQSTGSRLCAERQPQRVRKLRNVDTSQPGCKTAAAGLRHSRAPNKTGGKDFSLPPIEFSPTCRAALIAATAGASADHAARSRSLLPDRRHSRTCLPLPP